MKMTAWKNWTCGIFMQFEAWKQIKLQNGRLACRLFFSSILSRNKLAALLKHIVEVPKPLSGRIWAIGSWQSREKRFLQLLRPFFWEILAGCCVKPSSRFGSWVYLHFHLNHTDLKTKIAFFCFFFSWLPAQIWVCGHHRWSFHDKNCSISFPNTKSKISEGHTAYSGILDIDDFFDLSWKIAFRTPKLREFAHHMPKNHQCPECRNMRYAPLKSYFWCWGSWLSHFYREMTIYDVRKGNSILSKNEKFLTKIRAFFALFFAAFSWKVCHMAVKLSKIADSKCVGELQHWRTQQGVKLHNPTIWSRSRHSWSHRARNPKGQFNR